VIKRRAILWFRQDLRLHDNEALYEALNSADEIIPLYIFEDRVFKSKSSFGFHKTGIHRAKFILESIEDLRKSLRELGSELYVRCGRAEDIIFSIARKTKSAFTFCNRERTMEEVEVQDALEQNLWSIGREVRYSRGKMLYYTADLPFPVNHTPDQFGIFKKETERIIAVRNEIPLDRGISLKTFRGMDAGEIPKITEFHSDDISEPAFQLIMGGETEGLQRLHYFLWEKEIIKDFKANKNKVVGDYSTKFSPYLAQGCLSPKRVYHELKAYEKQHGNNESIYELFHHLMYRDYLRLMAKKHGNKIFSFDGIKSINQIEKTTEMKVFMSWAQGKTSNPFVNANMVKLNKTGFISFRGRETVAAYLIYVLGINWKMGAEYFESILIDYDPCSNWVNWNNMAGVGPETKDKIVNSQTAGKRFDPTGEFVNEWLNA